MYVSEAFDLGWFYGSARFIETINEGFGGNIPDFVMEIIGGEKEVKQATKDVAKWHKGTHEIVEKEGLQNIADDGECAGYDDLKEDVIAAYKAKKMKVPKFIQGRP